MKKRKRVIGGALLLLAAVGGIFFWKQNADEFYRIIKLAEYSGEVSLERKDQGKIILHEGIRLKNEDEVSTKDQSFARMAMDDDKYAYAEENTRFRLEAKGDEKASKTRIVTEQGAVTSEIRKKLKKGSSYEVETPNSVMSVRGTVYRVEVFYDENGESYTNLQVFDGVVTAKLVYEDGSEDEEEVRVPAGKMVRVHGKEKLREYVMKDADGQPVLEEIRYEELPSQALKNLKQMIDNGKHPGIQPTTDDMDHYIEQAKKREEQESAEPAKQEEDQNSGEEQQTQPEITAQESETQPDVLSAETAPQTVYTIRFETGGGKAVKEIRAKEGDLIELPDTEKIGYEFLGWRRDTGRRHKVPNRIRVTQDLTLYAAWRAKDNTPYLLHIFYETTDGKYYEDVRREKKKGITGETIQLPETPKGFLLNRSRSRWNKKIRADGTTEASVYYDRKRVTVTYHKADGDVFREVFCYGADFHTSVRDWKAGYDFKGYRTGTGSGSAWISEGTLMTSNLDLYSVMVPRNDTSYTIRTYFQQETEKNWYEEQEVEYGFGTTDTTVVPKPPQYQGYQLNLIKSVSAAVILGDGSGEIRWYYDRMPKYFQLQFYGENGTVQNFMVEEGKVLAVRPEVPKRQGYHFVEWNTKPDGSGQRFEEESPIAADQQYYAVWKGNSVTYEVLYYEETVSGDDVLSERREYSGNAGELVSCAPEEREGFVLDKERSLLSTQLTPQGGTLKVYYRRVTKDVRFFYGLDHTQKIEKEVKYGGTITPPDVRAPEGFRITAWRIGGTGNDMPVFTGQTEVKDNIHVYAVYSDQADYLVESYINGYGEMASAYFKILEETYQGKIDQTVEIDPQEGCPHGFEYQGGPISGKVRPDGSTVFKIYYQRKHMTITFVHLDQSQTATKDYVYGQPFIPKAGEYWKYMDNGVEKKVPSEGISIEKDHTFYRYVPSVK